MYICICNAVTDKQMKKEIDRGTTKFNDLCKNLGVARSCGKCKYIAKEFAKTYLKTSIITNQKKKL